jgi:hypothetical protein
VSARAYPVKGGVPGGDGPDCVEVAAPDQDQVLVRDSKVPDGPRLAMTTAAWARFLPYASAR